MQHVPYRAAEGREGSIGPCSNHRYRCARHARVLPPSGTEALVVLLPLLHVVCWSKQAKASQRSTSRPAVITNTPFDALQ